MNLPNKLTMLRILMIPVFIFFAAQNFTGAQLAAGIVFALASFTDFLDGHIARKQGIVTDFGKFADPLADKILTTTAFIYMIVDGVCAPLVVVIILAREFAVSGVRMVAAGASEGKVIAANMWGKVKTALQMLTIIFYYIGSGIQYLMPIAYSDSYGIHITTWILCWVVAAVTAVSGVQYIWNSRQYINTTK